jgi:adenosylcobinamide-GDP ribazoletransferase
MPQIEWKPENRRYALCFFPLVGAVIGVLFMLLEQFCKWLGTRNFLFGAGAVFLTVLITGGIHLDGFCDTCDARASWGDKERKLKILSDSHIGAFAAIKLGVYLVLYTALLSELYETSASAVVACGYVLSRSLSGLAAVTFKAAKKEGTLFGFTSNTHKNAALFVLSFTAVVSCCAMVAVNTTAGVSAAAAALVTMMYYHHMANKEFGGVTGDLAGWFLQVCELVVAAAAAFTYRIMEVIA